MNDALGSRLSASDGAATRASFTAGSNATELTGARSRWVAESGVLLVLAERGATWSLVAEATP